jgi:hypothetical protein
MLDLKSDQVAWADGNAWAPCIEEKMVDGKYKYFFYFSGNPVAGGGKQIGVPAIRRSVQVATCM